MLATIIINCQFAFSMEEIKPYSIEELKANFCPTLNNMGVHFPSLGPTEQEFYALCVRLDQDPQIKKPIVAIFGGAYGLRAVEALERTQRVTVILNDLEERHLVGIKEWAEDNGFGNRLILAPGSFFNLHEAEAVKEFFQQSPIQFNGILAANVYHALMPEEYIKGLGYVSDSLSSSGEAFLMNMQPVVEDLRDSDELATAIRRYLELRDIPRGEELLRKFMNPEQISHLIELTRRFQFFILYNFNKEHGIAFPGYFLITNNTLDPGKINDDEIEGEQLSHFCTTPEDVKSWSEIVGLSCQNIKNIIIAKKSNKEPEKASYYFIHLKKNNAFIAPTDPGHYSNKGEYRQLINQAQNVGNALRKLHKNKIFCVNDCTPCFGITDLKSGERYSVDVVDLPPAQKEAQNKAIEISLRNELLEEGNTAILPNLGSHLHKLGDYKEAQYFFTFGADIGIEVCQLMLDQMKAEGKI